MNCPQFGEQLKEENYIIKLLKTAKYLWERFIISQIMYSGKNMKEKRNMQRIKSGIIGLDEVIGGGFEQGSLIEVAGSEGTYKSTFALQYAIEGIRNGETVTYLSLEEPKESFQKIAENMGWEKEFSKIDFKTIDINEILFHKATTMWDSENALKGAEAIATTIMGSIDCPKRLIFDTATTLALYSSRTGLKALPHEHWAFVQPAPGDIRVMLFYLANECRKKKNTTVLFLAESGEGELYLPEEVLKYICDAKIELKKRALGTESPRTLQIHKMRHTNHLLDEMPLNLTGQGLTITPSPYVLEQHA